MRAGNDPRGIDIMPRQPANRMENKTATTTRESNPLPPSLPLPFCCWGCVLRVRVSAWHNVSKSVFQLGENSVGNFRLAFAGGGSASSAVHAVHVFLAFHSLFPHFSFSQNLSNAFDFAYRDCLPRCRCFWGLLCVVGVIEGRARAGRGRR